MDKKLCILLVEDNEGDIILTLEALKEVGIDNAIYVVRDGDEALQFLTKREKFKNAKKPDIILLDINLPKINGMQVLKKIKQDEHLMSIPVLMLTTSDSQKEINNAYQNYANCYITKPANFESFVQVIKGIENFWMRIVQLPG